MEVYLLLLFIVLVTGSAATETSLRFVFIVEVHEAELPAAVGRALRAAEAARGGARLAEVIVSLDREHEDESYRSLCAAVGGGVSALVDLSWSPWVMAEQLSADSGVPLLRTLLGSQQLVEGIDSYLEHRNATDAAILLETEMEVDRTLYHLLGASGTRVWVHAGLTRTATRALSSMRPQPAFHVVLGSAAFVDDTYARAVKEDLVHREYRWNLVTTGYTPPDTSALLLPTMLLRTDIAECCKLLAEEDCTCPPDLPREQLIITALMRVLIDAYSKLEPPLTARVDCKAPETNGSRDALYRQLAEDTAGNDSLLYWDGDTRSLLVRSVFTLALGGPGREGEVMGRWSAGERFRPAPGATLPPLRPFYRIGTAPAVPWTSVSRGAGGAPLRQGGRPVYEGYCIDLIARLAESMGFDYEVVSPAAGGFGRRRADGSWDGVVGDLVRGLNSPSMVVQETELAVAALTMTAEREEVIDFVPPYFDQTGILIVIRKPSRKSSLFKFMTVLRAEVWLSILAALAATGLLIWLLDKYSPYSARNDPAAYPYPCREFTLKESFWFALTSFTPQGGGEAPKALSGRALVAAYWLFVVLMLATFTANLAAFLTVERMQTPVSSLEQLARQSRINYTVVEGSATHQYFINMKFAEDTLYRVWKEITLNATSDQAQFRVWDYPVREQYGHILLAINASGPVEDAAAGFRQVDEHLDADFAFIHDSAEIRYELSRNCNLTAVGEVFAEQPYAVAVPQGSRLQEELSRALLDLQKERFLEQLAAKYWNESARQACPDADESEGITLESLGGVFIATLFGLGLAMITLAWEVFYYTRRQRSEALAADSNLEKPMPFAGTKKTLEKKVAEGVSKLRRREKKKKNVTIGESFKPAKGVSYISVYPKGEYRP